MDVLEHPLCGKTVDVIHDGELLVSGTVEGVFVTEHPLPTTPAWATGLVTIEGHGHVKHKSGEGRIYYLLVDCAEREL